MIWIADISRARLADKQHVNEVERLSTRLHDRPRMLIWREGVKEYSDIAGLSGVKILLKEANIFLKSRNGESLLSESRRLERESSPNEWGRLAIEFSDPRKSKEFGDFLRGYCGGSVYRDLYSNDFHLFWWEMTFLLALFVKVHAFRRRLAAIIWRRVADRRL